MRGETLFTAAQRHRIVTAHAIKFGCYHALKRHIRLLETGAKVEDQWLGLKREEADALVTFFGVTRWPGARQRMRSRAGSKDMRYIPRPNWYRSGSPLVLDTRWRHRDVADITSAGQLVSEINKLKGTAFTSDQIREVSGATPVHMLMLNPDMLKDFNHGQ